MFFKPSYISIYLLSLNVCAYVCVCICPPLKIENARLRPFAGHVPSTRQAPMPATSKATPISTAQRTRSGTPAGRNAAGRSRPWQGCQVASLQGCGTPGRAGGRAPGLPGRGTGRANLHRDRARVSPPRPPRSRPRSPDCQPCQPMPATCWKVKPGEFGVLGVEPRERSVQSAALRGWKAARILHHGRPAENLCHAPRPFAVGSPYATPRPRTRFPRESPARKLYF